MLATWIAHMRIAEKFLDRYEFLNRKHFLIGNIGPDCGVPNEDWSKFTPSKSVSHWMGEDLSIDAEDFRKKYLNISTEIYLGKELADRIALTPEYSFYLGYYIHLLTDIEWSKLYKRKKRGASVL